MYRPITTSAAASAACIAASLERPPALARISDVAIPATSVQRAVRTSRASSTPGRASPSSAEARLPGIAQLDGVADPQRGTRRPGLVQGEEDVDPAPAVARQQGRLVD